MKKKILFLLILLMPFMVRAEEKCTIVSGNGQDIGSEIDCAGEHFYIIEDKEDSVRMLAKYNLDIGYVYNKVDITSERYAELQSLCETKYTPGCSKLFDEPEYEGYKYRNSIQKNSDNTYTLIMYNIISNELVKQNHLAIGAHGDVGGKPEFPEYGVITEFSKSIYDDTFDEKYYGNNSFIDQYQEDYIFHEFEEVSYKLSDYTNYLKENGIEILYNNILSVSEINDIVYKVSNQYLPLDVWGNEENWVEMDNGRGITFYVVGSIKEYISEEYKWLYSTTYWTRTGYNTLKNNSWSDYDLYMFFVDTLGNICNSNACSITVGAGIRPVVEISKDSINYNLTTKSDVGGTLETDRSHLVGDTIVLNATPKTGYKLEKLIVTTESGIEIEVSGEDIVENDDGTISINPEVFTMPLENVVVEAKWAFVNPKTGVSSFIGIMMLLVIISGGTLLYILNENKRYEL